MPTDATISFNVPGKPQAKGRPIASARYGRTRVYTPAQTVAYEERVAEAARTALAGRDPLTGAVAIEVVVSLQPLQSVSKGLRTEMLAGALPPTKRPDLDNVVKAIIDGCCRVVFKDDAQITRIVARKVYGVDAGVYVTVALDAMD